MGAPGRARRGADPRTGSGRSARACGGRRPLPFRPAAPSRARRWAAAPLADAGLTPYHAIRRALHTLGPGASAIVIGVGGLGHVAVQLLKALASVRVVAVDRRDEALETATRSGADAALPAAGLTASELRRAAGTRGAALVVDCVGSDDTLALAAGAVAAGGHVSVLGLAGGTFP